MTMTNDEDGPFKAPTKEIKNLSAQKSDLTLEFSSNNLLNIEEGLVCTELLLTDDETIDEFTMNDDGDDNDGCSGYNNKDDEVQVINPTKTSAIGAIDAL